MKEKEERVAHWKKGDDLLADHYQPKIERPFMLAGTFVPPIRAIIAAAVSKIGSYGDLNKQQQVVAMLDEVISFIKEQRNEMKINQFEQVSVIFVH